MSTIAPYPLAWPDGVPRTAPMRRVRSPFRTGYAAAVENVAQSLRMFQRDAGVKIEHVVLSSNVDLINKSPADPGAAAWFKMDGQFVAFGVDRFVSVEANVQAIHNIIEARRTELKYGGLAIVRQTFKAFLALPAPERKHWTLVLALRPDSTIAEIEARYRHLAKISHPDAAGGSHEAMADLNRARDEALGERR